MLNQHYAKPDGSWYVGDRQSPADVEIPAPPDVELRYNLVMDGGEFSAWELVE